MLNKMVKTMAIKITLQKDIVLVRRWQYSSERKRSLPTNVYSVKRYQAPNELPEDVITEHNVDVEEQQTYADFVTELNKEMEKVSAKVSLRMLSQYLNQAKTALEDTELKEAISLDEYENLSNTINDIKKLVTKNKNALKRKAKNTGTNESDVYKLYEVSHEPHTSGSTLMSTINGTKEDAIKALYPLVEAEIKDSHERGVIGGVLYVGTHWDVINESKVVVQSWCSRDLVKELGLPTD